MRVFSLLIFVAVLASCNKEVEELSDKKREKRITRSNYNVEYAYLGVVDCTADFQNIRYAFGEGGVMEVGINTSTYSGTWTMTDANNQALGNYVKLTLTINSAPYPVNSFSGSFQVITLTRTGLQLIDDTSPSSRQLDLTTRNI